MKLRNKKTDFIGYIEENIRLTDPRTNETFLTVRYQDESGITCFADYKTIKEFNEEWEDYSLAEPLIKDEKIRKAVRAWAEANELIEVCYDADWNALRMDGITCNFNYDFDRHDGLVDACHYTIAELCGEEEE